MTPEANRNDDDRALVQAGYRYALSLTHDVNDAEDLVQQACLRVFRSRGRLVGKRYLFVAIRNLFIDRCRKRGTSPAFDPSREEEILDDAPSHVAVVEDRADLEHMLRCLRVEEREVLLLNHVEGYTAAEIGEITGQPRGTVLSQLARARKKLVERYGTTGLKHDDR